MVREKLYQRSGEKSRNFILSEKLYVFERCHRKVKSQMKETHSACLGLFYMKDDNVTREYCSVYLIDPCKHTVPCNASSSWFGNEIVHLPLSIFTIF